MRITVPSKLPFFLLVLMIAALITATGIEYSYGSAMAGEKIYHSALFRILWAAIAISGLWIIVRRKLWHRPHALLLHLSFVLILIGALFTTLGAISGSIHLRVGQSGRLFTTDEKKIERLPFEVTLTSFRVVNYPGTDTPADYVSQLHIGKREHVVSMNKIADVAGWRFYQSSYDTDAKGSILSIYHDPVGIALTYTGYTLLFLSLFWSLLAPRGTFRTLLRHPALRRKTFFLLLAGSLIPAAAMATQQQEKLPVVARTKADSAGHLQIVYNGRVCPLNTLATDFCKKITGSTSFRGISAEQLLLSWIYYPQEWQDVPMILIKNTTLRARLGIKGKYAALGQLYAGGTYQLPAIMDEQRDPTSPVARAIQDTDEKVGLILMLYKGQLIRPLSPDNAAVRLSDTRVNAEIFYNQVPMVKIAFMVCLTLGILVFICFSCGWLPSPISTGAIVALWILFFILGAWFCFRWYLSGYVPMSNGYETMLFMSICTLGISALLARRYFFAAPFGLLIAGFALLVAHLSNMNPQLTRLMPVLNSPLLSLHVTIMMFSYALFALMSLNSAYALWLIRKEHNNRNRIEQLTVLNHLLLHPAVFLLTAGIFIGAIWANVSWGRYWGWDPKEVWALITLLIYAFALHPGLLSSFRRPKLFHLFMLLAFLSVLFTYFGVNFILGGMHSYAG